MDAKAHRELAIQKFLTETTGDLSLTPATDLLDAGVLDSLTMMDLVVFIEVEFQHRLGLDDMRPEKFRTIGTIADLVGELPGDGKASRAA